ncbi:MAG: hypothetical protein AABW65_03375 [Nanoarchaeota archaeon]
MIKKELIIALSILLFTASVSALDTPITVQHEAERSITVNVLDAKSLDAIYSYENNTDSTGKLAFTYPAPSKKEISLYIIVRKSGSIVKAKQFDGKFSGDNIYIDLLEAVQPIAVVNNTQPLAENITQNITQNIVQNITETPAQDIAVETKNVSETNKSAGKQKEKKFNISIKKEYYYIIGAIILLIAIFFLFKRFAPKIKDYLTRPKEIVVKKLSEKYSDKEIEGAERRLRDAEAEITKIKSKRLRFTEAERNFEKARKDFDKAKREFI